MTQVPRNVVDEAVKLANSPDNNGDGFHLRMELASGRVIRGAIYESTPADPLIQVDVIETNGVSHEKEDAFIEKKNVMMATIVW